MREKYKVTEIYEMDFGCEERPEEMKDLVQVQLCPAVLDRSHELVESCAGKRRMQQDKK